MSSHSTCAAWGICNENTCVFFAGVMLVNYYFICLFDPFFPPTSHIAKGGVAKHSEFRPIKPVVAFIFEKDAFCMALFKGPIFYPFL